MSPVFLEAHWVNRRTFALLPERLRSGWTYSLESDDGSSQTVALEAVESAFQDELRPGSAHLTRYGVLRPVDRGLESGWVRGMLRSGPIVRARDASGSLVYETGVQPAGVLDDLFVWEGPLGFAIGADVITIRLWAPTARSVELLLFQNSLDVDPAARIAMEDGPVWTAAVDRQWEDVFYVFNVEAYVPPLRKVVHNIATDPYSLDLALNGLKSRLTNVNADRHKPTCWDEANTLPPCPWSKLSIYELHVRDFSITDVSVRPEYRGNYLAFTEPDSHGARHLRALAEAGLNAVHLLPTFHFASVDEDKGKWQEPGDLSVFAADSAEQQARIAVIQNADGFNWGYDPVHYLSLEGSYAVDPDRRVLEYREMVQALHGMGLRVVQDLVFNHTFAAGTDTYSILDRVVPAYYYRLDAKGDPHKTSCCPDTATEHRMMEKLMIDAIVHQARTYKIDGFRFDLMGFHFTSNLLALRQALDGLTLEKDGLDGAAIYIYGEGWNFGETANNQLGINASQWNLWGTGVGSFNDRMRDGVRGGSPFSDPRGQGFVTGVFTDPNDYTRGVQSVEEQRLGLLAHSDVVRISLAGNLRDYRMYNRWAQNVAGSQIDFNGSGAGYAAVPYETVNFCSVHDNQCLFDAIQFKSSGTASLVERCRRQVLALSLLALGQGIPFFHGGDDLLRSKSFDGNSYNSGDWFNRIDWSGKTSNWGVGLPLAHEHQTLWPLMAPMLRDPARKPTETEILATRDAFREFLRIRYSSDLFGLATLAEVQSNVRFLNWGPEQIPGLIVMSLGEGGGPYGAYRRIVVCFNVNREARQFWDTSFVGNAWELHPVQRESADAVVRTAQLDANYLLSVPALTTAVFVART